MEEGKLIRMTLDGIKELFLNTELFLCSNMEGMSWKMLLFNSETQPVLKKLIV